MTSIELRTTDTETQLTEHETKIETRSPGYFKALAVITTGIEKSAAGGYKEIKIVAPPRSDAEKEELMTLAQFFGGNRLWDMVNPAEFVELFAQYGQLNAEQGNGRTPKSLGPTTVRVAYESGPRQYSDAKSAAGNDYRDEN